MGTQKLVLLIKQFQQGVEGKGEDIEGGEERGQILLAVTARASPSLKSIEEAKRFLDR